MSLRLRLGIPPYRYLRPAWAESAGWDPEPSLTEDIPSHLIQKLRQAQLDGAFVSPLEYALFFSELRIVTAPAVVSEGASGCILLFFREGSRGIASLAADPARRSEIVLAHILLTEKYGIVPRIVPTQGSPEALPVEADAALLVGDEALAFQSHKNRLDLVDEWGDVTGLPFVHGFWAVREDAASAEILEQLSVLKSPRAAGEAPAFRSSFDDRSLEGLSEFYRMAYYHGILKDIPEVRFARPGNVEIP